MRRYLDVVISDGENTSGFRETKADRTRIPNVPEVSARTGGAPTGQVCSLRPRVAVLPPPSEAPVHGRGSTPALGLWYCHVSLVLSLVLKLVHVDRGPPSPLPSARGKEVTWGVCKRPPNAAAAGGDAALPRAD